MPECGRGRAGAEQLQAGIVMHARLHGSETLFDRTGERCWRRRRGRAPTSSPTLPTWVPQVCRLSPRGEMRPDVWPLRLQPGSWPKEQPVSHGPGLGRWPGPGRPGWAGGGWARCRRTRSRCLAGVAWPRREVFPPGPLPSHTQAERTPASSFTSQSPAPDKAGRCADPQGPKGPALQSGPAGRRHRDLGSSCAARSRKAPTLSGPSTQLCTKEAGSKLDRDPPSFLPPQHGLRRPLHSAELPPWQAPRRCHRNAVYLLTGPRLLGPPDPLRARMASHQRSLAPSPRTHAQEQTRPARPATARLHMTRVRVLSRSMAGGPQVAHPTSLSSVWGNICPPRSRGPGRGRWRQSRHPTNHAAGALQGASAPRGHSLASGLCWLSHLGVLRASGMLLNSPQRPGRPPNTEYLFPSVRVPGLSSPVRGPPAPREGWRGRYTGAPRWGARRPESPRGHGG